MLLSGDEFCNTQFGNNNAYCQDNEISYLDWAHLSKEQELYTYVQHLIALRKAHPVLRNASFDPGVNGTGYPELSFHGLTPWQLDECAPTLTFAYLFAEDHEKYGLKKDCFLYVAVNAHWEEHAFTLPKLPAEMKWYLSCEAYGASYAPGKEKVLPDQGRLTLGGRSTAVLIGK